MARTDLARCRVRSNEKTKAFPRVLNAGGAGPVPPLLITHPTPVQSSSFTGTRNSSVRCFHTKRWETDMLKGGLLWLIGIPLPIILILFFMGWLS
jgi:hypothetical protein